MIDQSLEDSAYAKKNILQFIQMWWTMQICCICSLDWKLVLSNLESMSLSEIITSKHHSDKHIDTACPRSYSAERQFQFCVFTRIWCCRYFFIHCDRSVVVSHHSFNFSSRLKKVNIFFKCLFPIYISILVKNLFKSYLVLNWVLSNCWI